MKRSSALVAIAIACVSSGAAAERNVAAGEPAVSAVLTYDAYSLDAEGVSRTSRYQESLVRQGGHLWIERVFPAGTAPARADDLHHINTNVCARSFTRVGADGVSVELVCNADRTVLALLDEDFETVGLSKRWSLNASLIDRSKLRPMAKPPALAPDGARWLEAGNATTYLRILWSERLSLPILIETGLRNGRSWQRTTLEIRALGAGAALPWQQQASFTRVHLSDLGD